jgi:hypothetical protein
MTDAMGWTDIRKIESEWDKMVNIEGNQDKTKDD